MSERPIAGLLGLEGTALVGEAVKVEFNLDLGPEPPTELSNALGEALASIGVRTLVEEKMQERVRKEFGDRYLVEGFTIRRDQTTIEASVTTLYDDKVDLGSIGKKAASVCASMREELGNAIHAEIGARPSIRVRWTQGEGLFDPSRLLSPDTPDPQLEAHLWTLKTRRRRFVSVRVGTLLGVAVLTPIAVALSVWFDPVVGLSVGMYALLAFGMAMVVGPQIAELAADIRDTANELDLRRIDKDDVEPRAQKLFQAHSFELKRYYDQALRQARTIYFVGFACLFLGFAAIGGSLWLVFDTDKDLSDKVVIAALGAIGGLLANYVAVVYLRMFSRTIGALTSFHQRLVMTHQLHFANFLASKVDDGTLRDKSLAAMAEALASVQQPEPGHAPAEE